MVQPPSGAYRADARPSLRSPARPLARAPSPPPLATRAPLELKGAQGFDAEGDFCVAPDADSRATRP
ncbi:hypothetical protein [Sorangium sp. So ce861]|uniref:hypothetical protein n=1 Tax=Sorangium sp. So ce861 TaxID=3133323 RepID=UPI003F61E70F